MFTVGVYMLRECACVYGRMRASVWVCVRIGAYMRACRAEKRLVAVVCKVRLVV